MSMRCRYIVMVDETRPKFFWATASLKSSVNLKLIESVTDFKATHLLEELARTRIVAFRQNLGLIGIDQ